MAIHARGDSIKVSAFANSVKATLDDIGGWLDLQSTRTGLEIYLFDSPWEMKLHLWQHCPEQSGKAAACFSRPGGYVVTVVKSSQPGRTDRMLRHELTHFILVSNYRDFPRWVDEGMAQYLEGDPSRLRDEKRKEFLRRQVPRTEKAVAALIALPAKRELTRDQYLLSWALVSFLIQEERSGVDGIKSYLANVEDDGKGLSHFESTFGSVAELFPRWESFLAREGLVQSEGGGAAARQGRDDLLAATGMSLGSAPGVRECPSEKPHE